MLKVYNPADASDVLPLSVENDKRYVTHKYGGYDTLTFEISSADAMYRYIAEEVKVEDESNRYVIKDIDEHSDFVTIVCELDLDEWREAIYYEYRRTYALLHNILAEIIPAGWTIVGSGTFTQRTTIEGNEGEPLVAVTAADILLIAAKTYSCVFQFDVLQKTITCIDPKSYLPSGQFFMEELNLKSVGYVGSSQNFATRLYAFGVKDGDGNPLTFADINDGKPYVENHSYSNKVVSIGWSDERYTDKASLLADAQARLDAIAFPERSYSCEARNLDESVWLYKVVTLVDKRKQLRVDHQVVEFVEYPDHALDVVTLSKVAPGIESLVKRVEAAVEEVVQKQTGDLNAIVEGAVSRATSKIVGNQGGHFMWVFDTQGHPVELLNLCDADDVATAKSVWRWNASGLGFSNNGASGEMIMALTDEGAINASAITTGILTANLIQAGVLQSANGTFYLDLETGLLQMNVGQLSVADRDISTALEGLDSSVNTAINTANDASANVAGLAEDVNKAQTTVQEVSGNVNNALQSLARYIQYGTGETSAVTIGTGDGAITLALDPVKGIVFAKNGVAFGDWDGVDFHTGNIIIDVNEKAQLGNFAYVPRSDGSLMFLKVAGATTEEDDEYEEFVPTPGGGGGGSDPQPQFSYTVESLSGVTYGFVLNASGYYESTNQGVADSFALCRISFDAPAATNIHIYFIHSGETTYDYGTIGAVDQALSRSTSVDSNVLFIGNVANKHSTSEQSVEATIPQGSDGQHFIDVKYVKDSSVDNAPDSIAFRIEVG